MPGGNSADRRRNRRARQHTIREKLWFIAEHPLLASGAGAMLLTGIATEASGWPTLAAGFYLAALLLLAVVFIRAELFRISPKRAWLILTLSAVFLAVLWLTIRPAPPPSASELAREIAKQLPVPVPEATPSLTIHAGSALAKYNITEGVTEVLLQVEIRNSGAPSAVTNWRIHYSSPTSERDLRPVKPLVPMLFLLPGESDVALEFNYQRDAITEKVAATPVVKEVPVRGRLLLNLPGDWGDDINQCEISISIFDYLGQHSTDVYKARSPSRTGVSLPGETVRRLTKEEKSRFH